MKKQQLLLGAHMSVSGGYEKAIERAESIGCTAMQIFTKSNRQWHGKVITIQEAAVFEKATAQSSVGALMAHATYLINIGSPDETIRKKSIQSLYDETERISMLGIPSIVLHPGSHTGAGEEVGLDLIVKSLNELLPEIAANVSILLENMAGQGTATCYRFEQLAYILANTNKKYKKNLGICFDTCHAFAAGYDFRTPETYKAMWKEFDSIIGLEHLKAIHLNDSKKELGSRVDRHEEIGEGKLGIETFKLIMNDPRLFDVPKILETPKDDLEHYSKNMELLKSLITKENKKRLGLE